MMLSIGIPATNTCMISRTQLTHVLHVDRQQLLLQLDQHIGKSNGFHFFIISIVLLSVMCYSWLVPVGHNDPIELLLMRVTLRGDRSSISGALMTSNAAGLSFSGTDVPFLMPTCTLDNLLIASFLQ